MVVNYMIVNYTIKYKLALIYHQQSTANGQHTNVEYIYLLLPLPPSLLS